MAEEFASVPARLLRDIEMGDKYRNAAKNIYLAVQNRAFACGCGKGGEFEISFEWITALTGYKETWIRTVLGRLEAHAYLRLTRRSGCKMLCELLPDGAAEPPHSSAGVGGAEPPHSSEGDPRTGVRGSANPPYIEFSLRREEGNSPSPSTPNFKQATRPLPRQGDLYRPAMNQPHWLASAVEFLLGADPRLDPIRDWAVAFVEEFFLSKFKIDENTDAYNAAVWVRHLAKIRPTVSEREAREAAEWLLFTPPLDAKLGKPIFSRDDLRFALVKRIQEQRQRLPSRPPAEGGFAPPTPEQFARLRAAMGQLTKGEAEPDA